jgi:endonuclease YncB( thermonuclease family)
MKPIAISLYWVSSARAIHDDILSVSFLALHCNLLTCRYKQAEDIPRDYFKIGREITGIAITVADGDGIRLCHQPLLACSPPNIPRDEVGEQTIRIRLAGIDAPEVETTVCLANVLRSVMMAIYPNHSRRRLVIICACLSKTKP